MLPALLALPSGLQKRTLWYALGKLAGDQEITSAQVENLLALAVGGVGGVGDGGFVVSDWRSIEQLSVHGFTANDRDAALARLIGTVSLEDLADI